MADALEAALLNAGRRNTLRLERVTIATSSPLTVTRVDGSTIPAVPVANYTYAVGAAGLAMVAEGIVPPVLPASASTPWLPYSPTISWALGTGTAVFRYRIDAGRVRVQGRITYGTTTTNTVPLDVGLPTTPQVRAAYDSVVGAVNLVAAAGPTIYPGALAAVSSSAVRVYAVNAAGTYAQSVSPVGAVPFAWAGGDYVSLDFEYDLL